MDLTSAPAGPGKPAWLGCRSYLLGVLVLAAIVYLGLRGLGAFLITGDPLERGDAIVVLGGGGEERVEEAVRLIEDKYGIWLIITEPGEMETGGGMGSQIFRGVAILKGISPDAILITEKTAQNTYQEAEAVLHLMQKHKLNSVTVVTDPFHTQRTRMIFRSVFSGSGLSIRITPVRDHWYRSTTWFLTPAGWGNTIREYIKMAGFYLGIYQTLE